MPPILKVLYSLLIASVGGFIGDFLNIPLGWLLGALVAVIISNAAKVEVSIPTHLRNISLALLGILLGSAFTPETLSRFHQWMISMSGVAIYLVLITPLGIYYYSKILKFNRVTATFAAVPGGLGAMVMLGWSLGGDPRLMALAHTARLTTILIVIPTLAEWVSGVDIAARQSLQNQSHHALSIIDIVVFACCATLGPLIAKLFKLPSPVLFGALLASAIAHVSGITEARLPPELVNLVQIVVGAFIGTAFGKSDYRVVLRIFFYSTMLTFLMIAIAALFAYGLQQITEFEFPALLLALTPGGIAEMGIIALLMNIDPVFVAAHHTFRVAIVYLVIPVVTRKWLGESKLGEDNSRD